MRNSPLRIGTRTSAMAIAQTQAVAASLTAAHGWDIELVEITTKGDLSSAPLESLGGTGVFVSALRDALLEGKVDLAVHSMKDLPTTPSEGLVMGAVPRRGDPRDVLCARGGLTLAELEPGARIGTGSPRREAQIRALRGDVDVVGIRGNADTRLAKMKDGIVDAVVLARAGLERLDLLGEASEVFEPDYVVPAPGQGALAVECRAGDAELIADLEAIDDVPTHAAVTAERTLLAVLEGGCAAPVGAYAEVISGEEGDSLRLRAAVVSRDGKTSIRKLATGSVDKAQQLGRDVAQDLLRDGAGGIVDPAESGLSKERVS